MTVISVESKDSLYKLLAARLKQHFVNDKAQAINHFAKHYYAAVPSGELLQREFDDIYAAILATWDFIQEYDVNKAKLLVFNPDVEQHGWQSTHTVIEIIHKDIPFLIDSIRMELNQQNITIHAIQNTVFQINRNEQHQLVDLSLPDVSAKSTKNNETIIYIEIDQHTNTNELDSLKDILLSVLEDVRLAVDDFQPMLKKATLILEELKHNPPPLLPADVNEAYQFINWLIKDHFTFLGYEEYKITKYQESRHIERVTKSPLGILKKQNDSERKIIDSLPIDTQKLVMIPQILIFAKSPERSRVHRPAYPDLIVIKMFNKMGQVIGERRFIGLYTSPVYHQSSEIIPILRRKVKSVIARSGFGVNSHNAKELAQILEVFPRDELFQISTGELLNTVISISQIQERKKIRLFIRKGPYGNFFSCLVYIPRDIYNTELRKKVQNILCKSLNALDSEFITYFSESILARTYFVLKVDPYKKIKFNESDIEKEIISTARSWKDDLHNELNDCYGEEQGNRHYQLYESAFPASYQESFHPRVAAIDIQHIDELIDGKDINISFYRAIDEENIIHFKLFHAKYPLPLSDVLPLLENLGFRVYSEHPYQVRCFNGSIIWIHDFSLSYDATKELNLAAIKPIFYDAFVNIWYGLAENDEFNRLITGAQITWRETALLRAYAKYSKQIGFPFSQLYIADILCQHLTLTQLLLNYFTFRLDPNIDRAHNQSNDESVLNDIAQIIDDIENLNEDRILRNYLNLITATVRTNFYQKNGDNAFKPYISLKFLPKLLDNIPLPKPEYEIFVYSPRVEGIHLRGGKIARGGIRWSDRQEDYRTEILGLVKAQQVKNAVIVPVGAKGGFVVKQSPANDNVALKTEAVECYQLFISGLLDLTDNLLEGEVISPSETTINDDEDSYLVVAADKGTAAFSDTANQIANEYSYWLGDAFASGGSIGYDHKKMGITARGAWVSVQHHFQLLGKNIQASNFTVVGIGDMSGDVFGNGMLLSKHIKLIAAFNHINIFIDPDPDPESSFEERSRLFSLPASTWQDYNAKLISAGGGVFSRSAKWIVISKEMKKCFGITQDRLRTNDLIKAILIAQVDLLWNGGIGTYIKSSTESNADVGDKINDNLRVNASELKCKVIGEGGNLGITQLGRVEYCLQNGRCNTDFIDNSGGVDCSDHEVNIKILLNDVVADGNLTEKQRNQLLFKMSDTVKDLVLKNNLHQVQSLSMAQLNSIDHLDEYQRLVNDLDFANKLNRHLEFMPDNESFLERKSVSQGLTRPELSILNAYVKSDLKKILADSNLVNDHYAAREIKTAFPPELTDNYKNYLSQHFLKEQIISTQIANDLINYLGVIYVSRLTNSMNVTYNNIAKSYLVISDLFVTKDLWKQIDALSFIVAAEVQLDMFVQVSQLLHRGMRWLIQHKGNDLNVESVIAEYQPGVVMLSSSIYDFMYGLPKAIWQKKYKFYLNLGISETLSTHMSNSYMINHIFNIIEVANITRHPIKIVAHLLFLLSDRLDLYWFDNKITELKADNHWQVLVRESFRDELINQQQLLTINVLNSNGNLSSPKDLFEDWLSNKQLFFQRWQRLLTELRSVDEGDISMYMVALRELSQGLSR